MQLVLLRTESGQRDHGVWWTREVVRKPTLHCVKLEYCRGVPQCLRRVIVKYAARLLVQRQGASLDNPVLLLWLIVGI